MTNYPNNQDNIITLPTVTGTGQDEIAINSLRAAVAAIEYELGIAPSGVYSDVRARLDILESRVNFSINPDGYDGYDGYASSPFYIWNVPSNVMLTISDGYGAPTESRVNGSLYMRADGYANNDLYIRRDGYWVSFQSELFSAAGDLTGNHLSQTVIALRGKSLSSTLSSVGASQDGYRLTWVNGSSNWQAKPDPTTPFVIEFDGTVDLQVSGVTTASLKTDKFILNKGQRRHVTTISSAGGTFTIQDGYDFIAITTLAASFQINLPASPTLGDTYQVKDTTGNASVTVVVTISGNGHNIDGNASLALTIAYSSAVFTYTGTQWSIG